MAVGIGATVMAIVDAVGLVPQRFAAVTLNVPLVAPGAKVIFTELEPVGVVNVAPVPE